MLFPFIVILSLLKRMIIEDILLFFQFTGAQSFNEIYLIPSFFSEGLFHLNLLFDLNLVFLLLV